jgi:hypothetical protein
MRAPARLLVAAMVLVTGSVLPATAAAGAATAAAPPVPLDQWVATFCQTFATYETDALAAAAQLRTAVVGVTDSAAAGSTVVAVTDSLRKAGSSAEQAARAATANGVPDVENGKALTRELRAVLIQASKTYAAQSRRAGSKLPVAPKRLSAAAKKIGTDLGKGLKAGGHAKRLQQLDRSDAMGGAVAADPTCAAAANAGGTTAPAQPASPGAGTP